jgi:hypothetical protein
MQKTGTVTVNHEHFKKSKLEYSNWMQAIFREAIQNSIDAKANKIEISYFKDDNEDIDLTFIDNGTGMSLDILLNVLLTMGGSKKDDDSPIGGFGYAKSILFFAHTSYTIKTNDIILEGQGGNYSYTENNTNVKGTVFNIVIENDCYHTELDNVDSYLKEIIEFSSFKDVNFIINDTKNLYKEKKFEFDLKSDLGDIKFSDNGYEQYSELWIRINGLAMFKHSVYLHEKHSSFVGALELNKSPLESLTANRDGLQYRYASQLNTIFSKLSEEREKLTYNGMFNFIINEQEEATFQEEEDYVNQEKNGNELITSRKKEEQENLIKNLKNIDFNNSEAANQNIIKAELKKVFKDLSKEEDKFQNFFQRYIKKINQKYYPLNFVVSTEQSQDVEISTYKNFFSELIKKRNIKLAIYWDTIINSILKASYLNEITEFEGNNIYIKGHKVYNGFIFGTDSLLGSNSFDNTKGHTLSINPLNSNVDLDFETIFDIAIHEVTHFIINGHNGIFCFEEFKLRRSIQKDLKKNEIKKDILSKIKNLKDN